MDIDEILKQQTEWVQRAQDVAMKIAKNRTGITPEDAGFGASDTTAQTKERIGILESRRDAMLAAFNTAIEAEQQSFDAAPRILSEPTTPKARTVKKRGPSK